MSICTVTNFENVGPNIPKAIHIDDTLLLTAFMQSVKLMTLNQHQFPLKIEYLSDITNVCDELTSSAYTLNSKEMDGGFMLRLNLILSLLITLKSDNFKFCNDFVYEQLRLLIKDKINYGYELLIFSALLHNISPHAYRFLRRNGNLILPCYNTIRRITLSSSMSPSVEQTDTTFLYYIKQKCQCLDPSDATVLLLVDEIHLKQYFDYKGGNIIGSSYNSVSNAAKSAFAFIISSIFSNYKDVVHLLPICKMTADELYIIIKKLVVGLESIGFKVIAVITDNNAINRKAMTKFVSPPKLSIVYLHPSNQIRPLFFFFDTVHLLKCVRNNWLNIKSAGKCISFPYFAFRNISTTPISTEFPMASFASLKYLHDAECDSLVKFAYKLSFKALNPLTFERQNVKLALQVFNNFTAQALTFLGEKTMIPHYENTSTFIKIITTWWQVVNVKTPLKGKRLQNVYEEPITTNEKNCESWKYFMNWLDK